MYLLLIIVMISLHSTNSITERDVYFGAPNCDLIFLTESWRECSAMMYNDLTYNQLWWKIYARNFCYHDLCRNGKMWNSRCPDDMQQVINSYCEDQHTYFDPEARGVCVLRECENVKEDRAKDKSDYKIEIEMAQAECVFKDQLLAEVECYKTRNSKFADRFYSGARTFHGCVTNRCKTYVNWIEDKNDCPSDMLQALKRYCIYITKGVLGKDKTCLQKYCNYVKSVRKNEKEEDYITTSDLADIACKYDSKKRRAEDACFRGSAEFKYYKLTTVSFYDCVKRKCQDNKVFLDTVYYGIIDHYGYINDHKSYLDYDDDDDDDVDNEEM